MIRVAAGALLVLALLCAMPLVQAIHPPAPNGMVFVVEGQVQDGDDLGIQWYTYDAGQSLMQLGTQQAKVTGTGQFTSWYAFSNGTTIDGAEVVSFDADASNYVVVESPDADGYGFDDEDTKTTCAFGKWCVVGAIRFYGEMVSKDDLPVEPEDSELIQVFSQGKMRIFAEDVTFQLVNQGSTVSSDQGIVIAYEDLSKISEIAWQPSSIYAGAAWFNFSNFTYDPTREVLYFDEVRNDHYVDTHSTSCGTVIGLPYCFLDQSYAP